MMAEAKEELRLFWHERFYGSHRTKLFAEPYRWSERLAFAGFEFEYPDPGHPNRVEEYYPNENLVRLFVLLSEPHWDKESFFLVSKTFACVNLEDLDFIMNHAQLVRMLDPRPLELLITALSGRQICNMLDGINLRGPNSTETEKVASWLIQAQDKLEELGNHLAIMPRSGYIIRRLQESGENGREAAAQLIAHLENIAKFTKETLDSLKGE
jgi:hypothetical protein